VSSSLSLLFPVELETVLLGEDTPASSSPYSAVDGGLFTSIPRMKVLVSFCDESEFGTEEVKLSFHEDLLNNPKEEEEGVTETDGFDLRLICFFGKFKPKLRPRSSFSNIIFC
jgi:hypothetical protein